MGNDKAKLLVQGEEQGARIVRLLSANGFPVTVLGREPINGARFVPDVHTFGGPLEALRAFEPTEDFVFVASCDLPRFDPAIVEILGSRIGEFQAATPKVDGYLQPLCTLYQATSFERLALDFDCPMAWLRSLVPVVIGESDLREGGIDPASVRGANTRVEFEEALSQS